jgi:hypothetical protein
VEEIHSYLQHVENFKGRGCLGDKPRMKENKINLKEITYEFETDLCGRLYDIVVMCLLCCVCVFHKESCEPWMPFKVGISRSRCRLSAS